MTTPDPEAEQRVAVLAGEQGTEVQLAAMTERGRELIDRAFDMVQVIGVGGVVVNGELIYQA